MKKSNVYTRTGDSGTTSLVGGSRVAKDDLRLCAYGTVDELNSWMGVLASSEFVADDQRPVIASVQHLLFDIGAILATEPESAWQPQPLDAASVTLLEQNIDLLDSRLERHNRFILPGGCRDAAFANVARTVARRAERCIVTLAAEVDVDPTVSRYINRLSDYLFVLGRDINRAAGVAEVMWEGRR